MAPGSRSGRRTRVLGEWVLGRRPAPAVIDGPEPYRPDLLLLVDAATRFIVGSEIVKPDASHEVVAEWVEDLIEPDVSLRVDDEGLASALRARLGVEHAVRVGPIPELRAPLAALGRFMGRGRRGRREAEPPWTDESSPESRMVFYEVAARFERSAPWTAAGDGQILRLDVPALGREGACASILGAAGEEFGLLLLRSLEDYVALVRLAEPGSSGGGRRGLAAPILSVNFDHPEEVIGGEVLARSARALGWKPGKEGRLAYLLKMDAEGAPAPLATEDYRLATVGMEAVRLFVEKERRLFRKPPKEQVETLVRVTTPEGEVDVRVTAPPADLPWAWGEEEPIDGLRNADAVAVGDLFREARRAAGASEEEASDAGMVVDEALRYKAARGEPVERWTPQDVEAYLLDHYPRRGGAPDEKLELVPLYLDALLEWLASSGRGKAGPLRTARARLARCREAFLRDARDAKLFGPAKTIARAMAKEGVDPSNRRAATRFLRRFNERLKEDPSLLPMPDAALRRRRPWVWTPGEPTPDPRGPCPCGSGRRYRKCCMPR